MNGPEHVRRALDRSARRQGLDLGAQICRGSWLVQMRLKRDGIRAETRFRLSAKRMSPFKSAGASVQSTTGSRGVRISGSNAGYTKFRGSVKGFGYPLHSLVSPSLPSRASPCAITFQLDSTNHTLHRTFRAFSGHLFFVEKFFVLTFILKSADATCVSRNDHPVAMGMHVMW